MTPRDDHAARALMRPLPIHSGNIRRSHCRDGRHGLSTTAATAGAQMSDEIVFYSSPMCRGRMVPWMLEEVGAPYRFEVVNLERGEQKKPDYLAVNPMGKVPAIVHRGTVVTECGAICTYLADAFPAARLAPPLDSPARGTYYRWMFFAGSTQQKALTPGPYILGAHFSAADVYVGS